LWEIAKRDHPEDVDDLMDFWIDVVSLEGKVTGFMAPRGRKLNGTVDKSSLYGLFHRTYIMVVRQLMPAHASALVETGGPADPRAHPLPRSHRSPLGRRRS